MKNLPEAPSPRTRHSRGVIAIVWLAATAAAITGLLVAAAEAEAGSYRAMQCSGSADAAHPDLSFRRTSDHYRQTSRCGGDGLTVTHAARASSPGRLGSWVMLAPDGVEMKRVRLAVAGRQENGHKPEVLAGGGEESLRPLGSATGGFHELVWEGGDARRVEARLRCAGRDNCGGGERAHVSVRNIAVDLRDGERPQAALAGALTERTGRGVEAVDVVASDAGAGVLQTFVEVNGEPLRSRKLDCQIRHGVAVRLRPCPRNGTEGFELDTGGPPFRQGPNTVRGCVLDYADGEESNRACAEKRVRVDNLCPISDPGDGARLEARLAGAGRRGADRGKGARVVGRLVDESGEGVAGAEVCVATRARAEGFAEEIAASPRTDPDGRFSARLEAGPSREVRVAHWADSERVLERMLVLRSAVRPRLGLRPSGILRNGQRLHFEVDLPGPRPDGRLAVIQAKVGNGWQRIRSGRTNGSGRFNASYRFHATTGRRRYAFRAFVPSQRGYPYERGHSPVRRKTVVG